MFDLTVSYCRGHSKDILYWDIHFREAMIRIYPKRINFFPSEITTELSRVDLLVLYDIETPTKKELQKCP